ncbi:substrate-binding protein [Catalinimonas alkaloidigena]|uniref:Substrate-binding protein n=1 Tax=Catalinimonas alkaloidigena TaxID=1075417 RepID=A0A1G9HCD1_9BACT|nr:helical backbone metal receptor [Catalinimonas alkaloidigena]SDL10522.1 substrate-binding protein [Catalinimonas alkaloidigena]
MIRPVVDQMGRCVAVPQRPQRIVSLVPSQTELLLDLGAPVVGRTKFCVHPADHVTAIPVVGGTKQYRFDTIASLQPDLIIGNKEENEREGIEQLAARYPVWMSDIASLDDALRMIRAVGDLVAQPGRATALADEIARDFATLSPSAGVRSRVAYLIWKAPMMVAGQGTFIHEVLTWAGWANAFGDLPRYPEITPDELTAARPDHIFLSSEPYPFGEKHRVEFQTLCPAASVHLVDGELFSWYGSRLRHAVAYLRALRTTLAANHD